MTVIVVGSSKSVMSQRIGHLVDQYDVIIRCNPPSSDEFAQYVGINTHAIAYSNPDDLPMFEGSSVALLTNHDASPAKMDGKRRGAEAKGYAVQVIPLSLKEECKAALGGICPSTGMQAIVFALHQYPGTVVDIIGFGMAEKTSGSQYYRHFYDKCDVKLESKYHDFERERAYTNSLERRGCLRRLDGVVAPPRY